METSQLPVELRDLIIRVATYPHGLGFLRHAYLDTVAVTLGTHPFVVEAARELLMTPSGRAMMIEEVRRARERSRQPAPGPSIEGELRDTASASPAGTRGVTATVIQAGTRPGHSDATPHQKEAEQLIAMARADARGIRFLLHAPPETVAVIFGVHPFIVFRARGLLNERGGWPTRGGQEEGG